MHIHKLYVCGFKDRLPDDSIVINTTSKSKDFGKAFSPFMNQGPIEFNGMVAKNVENAYQYLKCYEEHVNNPEEYILWRDTGLSDTYAHRYPMGKGRRPEFGWKYKNANWHDRPSEKLSYIDGRKQIYIPLYKQKLEKYCMKEIYMLIGMLHISDIYLWDFDGYMTEDSFNIILNNPDKNMGHAFIIKKFVAKILNIEF